MKRITTITSAVICLLCSLPQNGIAAVVSIDQLAKELSAQQIQFPVNIAGTGLLQFNDPNRSFADLIDTICDSQDPLATGRQFFAAFLAQINKQNGTSVSIEEACQFLRQNIDSVPIEYRELFFMTTTAIETNSHLQIPPTTAYIQPFSIWMKIWDWFHQESTTVSLESTKNFAKELDPTKVVAFAILVTAITAIAIYKPDSVEAATTALIKAFQACI